MSVAGRRRLHSEFIEESDSSSSLSSIGVFTNSRVSPTIATGFSHVPSQVTDSSWRSVKRRHTSGLNARFDRMLERINIAHSSPNHRRARSSGSSSVSSYDVPKTPIDAYSGLAEDRLGQSFSIIKMNPSMDRISSRQRQDQDGLNIEISEGSSDDSIHKYPSEALPVWLSNTFATLEAQHPLRSLVPPARIRVHTTNSHIAPAENGDESRPLSVAPSEDHRFAFSPTTPSPVFSNAASHQELDHWQREPEAFKVLHPPHVPRNALNVKPPTPETMAQHANSHDMGLRPYHDMLLPSEFLLSPSDAVTSALCSTSFEGSILPGPFLKSSGPPFSTFEPFVQQPSPTEMASSLHTARSSPTFAHNLAISKTVDPHPVSFPRSLFTDMFVSDQRSTYDSSHLHGSNWISNPSLTYNPPPCGYFDSSVEDPFDPDPSQPDNNIDLDYETLDFRWEPFIRTDNNDGKEARRAPSGHDSKTLRFPILSPQKEQLQPHTPVHNIVTAFNTPSHTDRALDFSSPWDASTLEHNNPHKDPIPDFSTGTQYDNNLDRKSETVFAPAPGIFVSPLRSGPQFLSSESFDDSSNNNKTIPTAKNVSMFTPAAEEHHYQTSPRDIPVEYPLFSANDHMQVSSRSFEDHLMETRGELGNDNTAVVQSSQTSTDTIESWTKEDLQM